jgi:hypothetical protein
MFYITEVHALKSNPSGTEGREGGREEGREGGRKKGREECFIQEF